MPKAIKFILWLFGMLIMLVGFILLASYIDRHTPDQWYKPIIEAFILILGWVIVFSSQGLKLKK
jgi:hypothetical protein